MSLFWVLSLLTLFNITYSQIPCEIIPTDGAIANVCVTTSVGGTVFSDITICNSTGLTITRNVYNTTNCTGIPTDLITEAITSPCIPALCVRFNLSGYSEPAPPNGTCSINNFVNATGQEAIAFNESTCYINGPGTSVLGRCNTVTGGIIRENYNSSNCTGSITSITDINDGECVASQTPGANFRIDAIAFNPCSISANVTTTMSATTTTAATTTTTTAAGTTSTTATSTTSTTATGTTSTTQTGTTSTTATGTSSTTETGTTTTQGPSLPELNAKAIEELQLRVSALERVTNECCKPKTKPPTGRKGYWHNKGSFFNPWRNTHNIKRSWW